jgi:hypothetical protein
MGGGAGAEGYATLATDDEEDDATVVRMAWVYNDEEEEEDDDVRTAWVYNDEEEEEDEDEEDEKDQPKPASGGTGRADETAKGTNGDPGVTEGTDTGRIHDSRHRANVARSRSTRSRFQAQHPSTFSAARPW